MSFYFLQDYYPYSSTGWYRMLHEPSLTSGGSRTFDTAIAIRRVGVWEKGGPNGELGTPNGIIAFGNDN